MRACIFNLRVHRISINSLFSIFLINLDPFLGGLFSLISESFNVAFSLNVSWPATT